MGDLWVVPGFLPVSLEDGLVHHRAGMSAVAKLNASDPNTDGWGSVWRPMWWPILNDGASGSFVVDLAAATDADAPVLRTYPEDGVRCTYSSITAMIRVFNECLRRGAYFVDAHADYEVADDLEVQIALEIDPDGDYTNFA